ncbi:hypothetical protein VY88_33025 [Azospirillum thiophilum]|uniref:Uncharacterized protein n=1 Tax=Azospirillum thiophilum TaxID=528244 RepID=A0AAC8ZX82_9PROT|nr:hypothetical protein AL072_32750 [Azospirillum thiophilum]KJR61223.1 hypothetical protein VY88_33025 [Azospirillum thiophilum]
MEILAAAASTRSVDQVTPDDLRLAFGAVLAGTADPIQISRARRAIADGDPLVLYVACGHSETAVERLLEALVRLDPTSARSAVVAAMHLRLTPALIAGWARLGKG